MEAMVMESRYQSKRHSKKDRLSPPLYHSRYVHLKKLNNNISSALSFISKQKIGKLVDFGCGEVPHKELLEECCEEYLAVDIEGNPNAEYFVDLSTNKVKLPSEVADVVWSIQVLEHVESYDRYLEEAHRLLKEDGLIVLSTHGQWKYHPDPIDYWRWTSSGLKETLRRNGFRVVYFKGNMGFLTTTIQLFQDAVLLAFPLKRFWEKPFCLVMQLVLLFSEWFCSKSKTLNNHRNLDSDVYFIVAEKIL